MFRSLTFNCPENQKEVVQLGVAPLILEAIRHFSADAELQSAAFMSIQVRFYKLHSSRQPMCRHITSPLVFTTEHNVAGGGKPQRC